MKAHIKMITGNSLFSQPMPIHKQIILAIDPGTVIMGYALIAVSGNKIELMVMDILKHGPEVEVLAPQKLRKRMSVLVQQTNQQLRVRCYAALLHR